MREHHIPVRVHFTFGLEEVGERIHLPGPRMEKATLSVILFIFSNSFSASLTIGTMSLA
jgi:hypothetical protein